MSVLARALAATMAGTCLAIRALSAQPGSPAGPVPVERLAARRAALIERVGGGMAIFGSEELRDIERDYPQDSDFRQDNHFFYLTGLETPASWLVLRGGEPGGGTVTLYLPPRDPPSERWTGPKLGPGPEATRLTGITDVRSAEAFESDVAAWLAGLGRSGSAAAAYVSQGSPAHRELIKRLAGSYRGSVADAAELLAQMRLVKDDEELRRLRKAIEITGEAHREGMRLTAAGLFEYHVEAAVEYVFRASGAERVGFPSIIGSGPNSVTLHYDKNRRQTRDGELVVIDIGAEFGYYTADVTRTIPVSGTFTPRQRAVYELVLGAQEAALKAVRPGVTTKELDAVARVYMDGHSGDLCGSQSCSRYFVHSLSHWLGMDVHDVGDYQSRLEPGMVLTIEPGIYIPDEELGIRIEDDVLVTSEGGELLTAEAPRTPDAIEAVMREPPLWLRSPEGASSGDPRRRP